MEEYYVERVVVQDSKTILADLTDRTNVYNLHELQTNYFTFSEPDLNAPYNFW